MTVLRAGLSLIVCLLITALFATTGVSAQADSPYTLEQIKRHLETLYSQDTQVTYRVRDTYAYVYGLSDAEFQIVRDVARIIEHQTQQKITVLNERQDFPPEIEKHASMIMFLDHMTDQVLKPPFHDEFTRDGWPLSEFAKHVADLKRTKGLRVSKFVRSHAKPRDRIIQQAVMFVERDYQRLGYTFAFRRYVFRVLSNALVAVGASNVIRPSVFNTGSEPRDLEELPFIDVAYIRALYAHDNWAQLSRDEAIDQLARTMKAFLNTAR